MKKILILFLVFTMVIVLFGCADYIGKIEGQDAELNQAALDYDAILAKNKELEDAINALLAADSNKTPADPTTIEVPATIEVP